VQDNSTEESDDEDSFNDGSLDDASFVDAAEIIHCILVSYSSFITKAKKDLITNLLVKVPDEYQNEIVGIESFFVCLTKCYNVSPEFFRVLFKTLVK
jgi:hypothetical protein